MNSNSKNYSDAELDAMCLAAEKEQIYKNYRAAIDEYNKLQDAYNKLQDAYNKLEYEHQILQNLFVQDEFEHDEIKVKYDQCRSNYHTVVQELKKYVNRESTNGY